MPNNAVYSPYITLQLNNVQPDPYIKKSTK
jgi:hypothetical protein